MDSVKDWVKRQLSAVAQTVGFGLGRSKIFQRGLTDTLAAKFITFVGRVHFNPPRPCEMAG
jgi:hypothetical protein